MFQIKLLFIAINICYLTFAFATRAFAYLDPGTGNALLAVLASIIAAVVFALQGLFYKLTGKKKKASHAKSSGLVIFSEGKSYWLTWKPIVEELLSRHVHFAYYTMDIHDPCLTIENEFMDNRYIGSGTLAYAKMGRLNAELLLSTTPNIGTEGYPMKRSPNVRNMVHIYHGLDDEGTYHRHALDSYDTVLLSGEFQVKAIRKLESLRGLAEKTLVPAGLPYLDEMATRVKPRQEQGEKATILVAPSWGTKNCLARHGVGFIKKLASEGFNVIIRPHPQTLKVEADLLNSWQEELDGVANISWDFEADGSLSLSLADIMISDMSAVRLDFVILYQKPVVTLETTIGEQGEYEVADLGKAWSETIADRIGVFVPKEKIGDIVSFVREALASGTRENLTAFREENLYNFGTSAKAVADYVTSQVKQ